MATTKTPFEPTSSWCYNFARYEALPEILRMPEVVSGEPFLLRELTARLLNERLSAAEQNMTWIRPRQGEPYKVKWSVKFYVAFLLPRIGGCVAIGQGVFRRTTDVSGTTPPDDKLEEIEDEAIDDADSGALDPGEDLAGWIYAFSFPMIQLEAGPFPIKIGKTIGDVESRVNSQCKGSASFEAPAIVGRWKVKRMSHTESAIHYVLKARGKWREAAPGQEWFDTTPQEVEEILQFVAAGD